MPKGPSGEPRLTSVGPFTYDENKPPEVPHDFSLICIRSYNLKVCSLIKQ